jgi:nucleoside-diphosphate-sugar epimerase
LVTGATGFIGSRLAERLIDDGWSVRVLARSPEKLSEILSGAWKVVVGDLDNIEALGRAVRDVEVVFHCAANVGTWDSWPAYESVNVRGVRNLLSAILEHNPGLQRLVHVSTVDVYGYPDAPADESSALRCAGFGYGDSKLRGESVLREIIEAGRLPVSVIRPANVIGPGSQFIERIGAELKSGLMMTIDGGRANAGILYIDTLLDYLLWASQDPRAIGQTYNVRDAYDVTWDEFVKAFRKAIHGKGIVLDFSFRWADRLARWLEGIHRIFLPRHEPHIHRLLVRIFGKTCGHSAEKIRMQSGITSRISFDEAINRSVRWFNEVNSRR